MLTTAEHARATKIRNWFLDNAAGGKFFSCTFVKRTTGEKRRMICRLGVKSRLRGGEKAYVDEEKGLLSVFDTEKDDYRCIPCENVTDITLEGVSYSDEDVLSEGASYSDQE